jgi:cbb3-type cytochrome oxidase subunit 3
MIGTGYLIAIGLFVFGFVILALIWLLNTIEKNNYNNKKRGK